MIASFQILRRSFQSADVTIVTFIQSSHPRFSLYKGEKPVKPAVKLGKPTHTSKFTTLTSKSISSTSSTSTIATLPSPGLTTEPEITLNCLIHSEPIDYIFRVIVRNNTTIDVFRKLIKEKNEPEFNEIATRLLKLWKVDVHFDSDNLGNPDVNIATVLNGNKFFSRYRVGNVFPEQPPEDHVHIIIELPTIIEERIIEIMKWALEVFIARDEMYKNTLAMLIQEQTNTIQMLIQEQKNTIQTLIQEQKNTIQTLIQDQNNTIPTPIQEIRQLTNTKALEKQAKKPIISLSSMGQSELIELRDIFQLSIIALDVNDFNIHMTVNEDIQPFSWDERNENHSDFYDTKSKKSLLSLKSEVLPFEISGTTDLSVQDFDVPQAIGQLLTANIYSQEVVLWCSKLAYELQFPLLRMHLETIHYLPEATFVIIRKLGGESHRLELFLNRSKVPIEFEDEVVNMDLYDVMT
ncbi:hypothetical protein RCL_jg23402.t1 [Rhizophagus clarus]|uniref:Crinkler effector protein N-terminal domain-containing protein n=1 Tax=Rhizophagus clarus TaxID=94130 RepID=A0A8H3QKA5_9GLOM|nr:hypothetical protein RCL_jg23402.t1 [Rhizophagus clarus]